jgi:hypothetical protein
MRPRWVNCAAFHLSLFQRQPKRRLRTTTCFYEEMRAHGARKAFPLETRENPTWLPRK